MYMYAISHKRVDTLLSTECMNETVLEHIMSSSYERSNWEELAITYAGFATATSTKCRIMRLGDRALAYCLSINGQIDDRKVVLSRRKGRPR